MFNLEDGIKLYEKGFAMYKDGDSKKVILILEKNKNCAEPRRKDWRLTLRTAQQNLS